MRPSAAIRLTDVMPAAAASGTTLPTSESAWDFESSVAARRRPVQGPFLALVLLAVFAVAAWAASAGVDAGRLVLLLALAPLLEEAVFRAGLHEQLLRRPGLARHANLLTALAFGLAHVLVQAHALAAAVVLPAWLIGLAYERWRRVRLCAALHALFNALWIAWVVAGPAVS